MCLLFFVFLGLEPEWVQHIGGESTKVLHISPRHFLNKYVFVFCIFSKTRLGVNLWIQNLEIYGDPSLGRLFGKGGGSLGIYGD